MKHFTGTTSITVEELTGSVSTTADEFTGTISATVTELTGNLTTDFEALIALGEYSSEEYDNTEYNV